MLHPQPQQYSILQRKEVPDGVLVRQALAGNQCAFEFLVNRYHHQLVSYIRAFSKTMTRSTMSSSMCISSSIFPCRYY